MGLMELLREHWEARIRLEEETAALRRRVQTLEAMRRELLGELRRATEENEELRRQFT